MSYADDVKDKDAKRLLSAIRHQRVIVREKRRHWEEAQKTTRERKLAYERARERLEYLADEPESELPLLDMMDGEGWRGVPLAHVVNAKAAAKIEEQLGVRTLGEFCVWEREPNHDLSRDVKGFGTERAGAVHDEMLQFWMDHPEYTQPPGADDEEEDEAA